MSSGWSQGNPGYDIRVLINAEILMTDEPTALAIGTIGSLQGNVVVVKKLGPPSPGERRPPVPGGAATP